MQTANSTSFLLVRRALRTLYNDETTDRATAGTKRIWWTDNSMEPDWDDGDGYEEQVDDLWWSDWSPWHEWTTSDDAGTEFWSADDWSEDWWTDDWTNEEDVLPDETSADPEETQLSEAFAIANEANRTLKEAREAVRRVRAARGYYAPESNSGKGKSGGSSKSSSPTSKQGSKSSFGPCFVCGMRGHGYQ